MARKVFLSFLGTTNYQISKYYIEGTTPIETRFVQIASYHFFCDDFDENDKVIIFTSLTAKNKNWKDDFEFTKPCSNEKTKNKGLKSEFEKLKIKPKICEETAVNIPEETSEKNIWETFKIVFEHIEPNDEIVLDITHGFRSSPMLLMVLINYAKFLKNIKVRKILYGAFEARNKDKNETKIWDLTNFSILQDWTSAASDYINYGDANYINSLTKQSVIPFIKEDSDEKFTAIAIKQFVKKVFDYTQNIRTVRGFEIYKGEQSTTIKNNIEKIRQKSFIKPLIPILEKIDKNNNDTKISITNIFNAVEYCIKHNLIQQGITFLQEGIISLVLKNNGIDWFVDDKQDNNKEIENNRNIASSALTFIEMKKNQEFKENSWHFSYWDKENIDKILSDDFSQIISSIYVKLSKLRNDINHSGYIEKRNSKNFAENLDKLFSEFKEKIKS